MPSLQSPVKNLLRISAAIALYVTVLGCGRQAIASNFRQGVSLTPSLTFTTLTTGTSAPQSAVLTNTTHGALPINGITLSGTGFTIVGNTCPQVLSSGASCQVTLTFAESNAGTYTGALTFTHDNGPDGSIAVALSGTSVVPAPKVTLSTPTLSFAALTAGTTSSQSVLLTNSGTADLDLSSVALSGPGANIFQLSNGCGGVLAAGSSCSLGVTFSPLVPGSYSAQLVFTDNASDSPQSISLRGSATPAALTIDTTNPADWKIANGALTLDFDPAKGRIFHIFLNGYPDDLTDQTSSNAGIYMDNAGVGGGAVTTGYVNNGTYLDWWVTSGSTAKVGWAGTMHFFVFPNDPGIHTYFVASHSSTDIASSIGQVQWVYRSNLDQFGNTYSLNADLSNPNPVQIQLPPSSEMFSTAPGRAVQDATADLHGFTLPASFTREFYTKYDYSTYNYLHQAHGTYGSTYGTWAYFPSNESLVAGPTKQNLIFTGNLLMIEAFSNHLDNGLSLIAPLGTPVNRLFGPFYIHFNTYTRAYNTAGTPITNPNDMYADTLTEGASFVPLYDQQATLLQNGYIPSTQRGSVSIQIPNIPGYTAGAAKKAWAVLSDPGKNFQFSSAGYQYWADISQTGTALIQGVAPGTYRLSVYVLGQFGELRQDGIVVNANQTTTVPPANFVPENFGTETVFTIGTPDRSSHEFLHGHDAQGHDDREYWGNWNYWADFAANNGSVVYNATSGPAGPAINDPNQWNYNHWGSSFDPGLYAGIYNSSDTTTDGYTYIIPPYVASLPGAKGVKGVGTSVPAWTVHFASPADVANFQTPTPGYAVLSVGLACTEGSYVVTLNGTTRVWGFSKAKASDCAVRSGLSGYYQWVAFEFPASLLNPAGQDNVMSIGVSQVQGAMDDALRLELGTASASSATTHWFDYEYTNTNSSAHQVPANDAVPNP